MRHDLVEGRMIIRDVVRRFFAGREAEQGAKGVAAHADVEPEYVGAI
jgi:hypothetical protein